MDEDDPIETTMPIYLSESLKQNLHLFQYPLLARPLEVSPGAKSTGKRIKARHKPKTGRYEVHVPNDTREDVWNAERGKELGQARAEEDAEEAGPSEEPMKSKKRDYEREEREREEKRLDDVRLRSEKTKDTGVYMLGVIRDGKLYLHRIQDVQQLRPSLTYLDAVAKKQKRTRAVGDSDDEGPPPDPDEPAPPPSATPKEKKKSDAKEVLVTARKTDDKSGAQIVGGLSAIRREMLNIIREEQEEKWQPLDYKGIDTKQSQEWFNKLFETSEQEMRCLTTPSSMLSCIEGLRTE